MGRHPRTISSLGLWSAILAAGAAAQLDTPVGMILDGTPESLFGSRVGGAGDINADGRDDLWVWAAGQVTVHSGIDGALLHAFPVSIPTTTWGGLGISVSAAGDVDRDGHDDLLIGDAWDNSGCTGCGKVVLWSGATGQPIHVLTGSTPLRHFGRSVSGGGDLDGDDWPDFIVGAPDMGPPYWWYGTGHVTAYSGLTGSLLYVIECGPPCKAPSAQSVDGFGKQIEFVGDVNGDGRDDWASSFASYGFMPYVGTYFTTQGISGVRLHSGTDGSLLREWKQEPTFIPAKVVAAGDLDADGVPDVAIASADSLRGVSVATGQPLFHLFWASGSSFLSHFSGASDVNGDGHDDLLVGLTANSLTTWTGSAVVHSGKDGEVLARLDDEAGKSKLLGQWVALAGDVLGNGKPSLVAGDAWYAPAGSTFSGRVLVFSVGNGSAKALGTGCAGPDGFVPRLTAQGTHFLGTEVAMTVDSVAGGSKILLCASIEATSLSAPNGCSIVVNLSTPSLCVPLVALGTGPGQGKAEMKFPIPSNLPIDLPLTLQAFVTAPGALGGWLSSNGLTWKADSPTDFAPTQVIHVDAAQTGQGDGSEGSPFARIQDGIDVAKPGDTVLVRDGLYRGTGNVNISFRGKNITVRSVNGPQTTVLDAEHVYGKRHFVFADGESPASVLSGFTLTGGVNPYGAGGSILCSFSSPTISRCIITGNLSSYPGGGVAVLGGAPRFRDCWIVDNSTSAGSYPAEGGGVSLRLGAEAVFEQCTVAFNRTYALKGGGFRFEDAGESELRGCIVWGNTTSSSTAPSQLSVVAGLPPVLSFCDVQGNYAGIGNFDANPQFVVNGPLGDYHLKPDSPCVDAGDPCFPLEPDDLDIDGEPRLAGPRIDLGADERP